MYGVHFHYVAWALMKTYVKIERFNDLTVLYPKNLSLYSQYSNFTSVAPNIAQMHAVCKNWALEAQMTTRNLEYAKKS